MKDPLFRRILQHAEKRLSLPHTLPYAERLPHYQEFLRLERKMIFRYHRNGESGIRVAEAHAIIMDVLIQNLFDQAMAVFKAEHGRTGASVCVVALGGYGRSELCPHSDVDIMFLHPHRLMARSLRVLQETMTREILYPLWDLGLKVGYSTRTVRECMEEARKNIQTKNSLLEARRLCGSKSTFSSFEKAYRRFCAQEDFQAYFEQRMQDQRERHQRQGGTVFMQEPNIKNGLGGLRDYQNILWMAEIRHCAGTLGNLLKKKHIGKREYTLLHQAYEFLLRVRNELHFNSKRPTDVLRLDDQPDLALNLGYSQKDIFDRVEAFMHDYYTHARNIYQISRLLERQLAITDMPGKKTIAFKDVIASRQHKRVQANDGFVLEGQTLDAEKKNIFQEDPLRLIRVFRHLQTLKATPSLALYKLIRDSVHLITPKVIVSPAAGKSFRAILQTVGEVHPTLSLMHELGVLGRYLPEFDKLTCLVQHEYYHLYTADIHTLQTIKELDDIFADIGPLAKKYRDALRETPTPSLLYLMLLLHDIGKAKGIKGHAESGLAIAKPILDRLEIRPEHQEQILFIIRNHLEMARFSLNYDVNDPSTAESLASVVGTADNLRFLYVHSFCDARGTSQELWNGYKDSLHSRLYDTTIHYFNAGEHIHKHRKQQLAMIRAILLEKKGPEVPPEEVEAHFNLLPERYFLHHTEEEILIHLRLVNSLLHNIATADSIGSLKPVIHWHNDNDQNLTVVHVVTWDRAGLFYRLAGAFTVAGLNIISTKAITRADHITIDTFYLVEAGGGAVQSDTPKERFNKAMEDTLLHNRDLYPEILSARKRTSSLFTQRAMRLRVPIPSKVDIYHELSLRRTIVEIQTNDRVGLLYMIAKSIHDHGFDIAFARISTERDVAIDTFYIESMTPGATTSTSSLVELRESLTQIINEKNHLTDS